MASGMTKYFQNQIDTLIVASNQCQGAFIHEIIEFVVQALTPGWFLHNAFQKLSNDLRGLP